MSPAPPRRPFVLELTLRVWTALCALARWSWPHLQTAARLGLTGLVAFGRVARVAARQALRHRASIVAVATRAAWWSALWLWLVAGQAFFDLRQPLDGSWMAPRLLAGFTLCLLVLCLATERRLRWAAWLLGLGHGALGLLALTLLGA